MQRVIIALAPMLLGAVLLAGPSLAEAPSLQWVEQTASPRAARPANIRDRGLSSMCPETDGALGAVAAELASHKVAADDVEAITYALRAAGEPHVWPRAFLLEGRSIDSADAKARFATWLQTFRRPTRLRCGIASASSGGKEVLAVVAIDAQADLAPIPVRVRTSSWVEVDAKVNTPASGAKVIVLGPTGAPRTVPTSFADNHVKARANVDRPGTWLFQVLLDGATGPRPVLEAYVFAGVEPPRVKPAIPAPGEEAGAAQDVAAALTQMVLIARRSEGLPPLAREVNLDRVARGHAERMMRARQLGHDVGDGDPKERLERAGIFGPQIGENVAHAANVVLAHRALWSSPSHRDNMLQSRFDRLGVGVSTDPDGSVWVTEVFAARASSF